MQHITARVGKMKHVCLLYCLTGWLFGCAPSFEQLNEKREVQAKLRRKIHFLEVQRKFYADYDNAEPKGKSVQISKNGVRKLLAAFYPLKVPGEKLIKKHLKGQIQVSDPFDVRTVDPVTVGHRVRLSGHNIKVNLTGVPFATKGDEKKLRETLRAGAVASVKTKLRLDRQRGGLWLESRCEHVELKKHDSRRQREYLREVINKRLFNVPKLVKLPKSMLSEQASVYVFKDGIVFVR